MPGFNYAIKKLTTPNCYTCDFLISPKRNIDEVYVKLLVNGKKKRIRVKYRDMYCINGTPFKINKNHVRWWGFSNRCPLNPYIHTCLGCGQRMCTQKTVCSGCRKNNDRFNGNM